MGNNILTKEIFMKMIFAFLLLFLMITSSFAYTPNPTGKELVLKGATAGRLTIQPNASFTDFSLIFPANDGSSGQFLSTDGSGVLSWQAAPTPAVTSIFKNDEDYSIASGIGMVIAGLMTQDRTFTLPAASGSGRTIVIKRTVNNAFNLIVAKQVGDTIDGAAQDVLTEDYEARTYIDADTNVWLIQA
jgi:hypothetical protein